jgi:hypothetical protein
MSIIVTLFILFSLSVTGNVTGIVTTKGLFVKEKIE